MSFIDDLLSGKNIGKEANLIPQGENREDHFERKVEASNWISDTLALDPEKVEREFLAAQAAEARLLGKTAAYEQGDTVEETLKKDYTRDVECLSDYALAEIVAGIRGHAEQNTSETFSEKKEEAKKNVASNRKKVEEEVLKATGMSAQVDWQKEFARYSKEAKPEEPKEKDLFKSEVPEKAHDFEHPSENKFKVPADQEKAIPGNGREADERKEVTQEAGVLKEDIVKKASIEKTADEAIQPIKREQLYDQSAEIHPVAPVAYEHTLEEIKTHLDVLEGLAKDKPEIIKEIEAIENGIFEVEKQLTGKVEMSPEEAKEPEHKEFVEEKKEELPVEAKAEGEHCPVCGGEGRDLKNNETDHLSCMACGINYAPAEIKSQASKAEVIKKIAEIQSPWAIIKDAEGNDVIARIEQPKNEKVSEDEKEDELKK